MGIARETTGELQQGGQALVLAHLVEHRALDITRDTHQTVVRTNRDDIVVVEHHITGQTTIQDVFVDIDHGDQFTLTVDLDISEGSEVVGTTCTIEGMEDRGKGTQRIGAGEFHLTHHLDHDATGLTNSQLQVTAGITGTQRAT